ncbi:MAG: hypothetical protein QNK85_00660 [Crocinitomicaceae bacterium]|jgi:hypothetical protein
MLKPVLNKGFILIGAIIASLMLNTCGIDTVSDVIVGDDADDEYYEFQDFNLGSYDIPAVISLPDETANIGASTKPDVNHIQGDIKWELKIGSNFQMIIEDYGDINDLIKVKKKELAEQSFFKVKYLIDELGLILYERTLLVKGTDKASPNVGVEHRSYHVYGSKVIKGITYEVQSREDGYEKVIIELMAKSIKSLRPIE